MKLIGLLFNFLLMLVDRPRLLLHFLVQLPNLLSEIVPFGSNTLCTTFLSIKRIFRPGELSLKIFELLMELYDRRILKERLASAASRSMI